MAIRETPIAKHFRLEAEALEAQRPALTDLSQHPGWLYLMELIVQHENQAAAAILDGDADEGQTMVWWRGHRACSRSIINTLNQIAALRPLGEGRDKKKAVKRRGSFERGLLRQSGSGPGARE